MNSDRTVHPEPVAVVDLSRVQGAGGVVWSISPPGFHSNLVVLEGHGSIADHRNDAVDVLIVVLAGDGTIVVDGAPIDLAPASAVLVPRGATRSIFATEPGLRYLTLHEHRSALGVARRKPTDA